MKEATGFVIIGVFLSQWALASNEVLSGNIVGYQTITVSNKGYYMVAQPFNVLGRKDINSVIGTQLSTGTSVAVADNISFYDNAGQTYIANNWLRSSDGKWCQGAGLSTQTVDAGRCFWMKLNTNLRQQVTILGEVVTAGVITQTLYQGVNMVAYPYSANLSVTNTGLDAVAVAGNTSSVADQIIKFNPATQGYDTYWKSAIGWKKGSAVNAPELKTGEAFWFLRRLSGTTNWVEIMPYKLL
ncbi:MAG: hypothetical protein PH343_08255 [Nitrospira sp.]|nr:hypothetical protein [Nitrospira sp.]